MIIKKEIFFNIKNISIFMWSGLRFIWINLYFEMK
jgi:hypothetical protein